jgi:CubicO group peptidase (beta-lactamase class C family)
MGVKHAALALKSAALAAGVLAAFAPAAWAQAPAGPLPSAKPEDVGISSERLARIGDVLNRDIADGKIPGAVLAIARDGKLVFMQAYGYRDKAGGVAMTTDTIFNIASMTKPMTTVAALTLVEQGRLVIDEPVSKYLPSRFTGMKVATLDASGESIASTAPAIRPISTRDLLTHTSGLIYGGRGATAVHKMYPAGSGAAAQEMTGDDFLTKLSGLPLLNQPGAVWDYGFGLDVTGLMVEALTKRSLGAYLSETVFTPLGMTDTGFFIPSDKAARYAKALPTDPETGKPQTVEPNATQPLKFECGGGCAVSTAADYLRFASMLLNHGEYDGHRILSRKMAEYMLSNQLGPQVRNLIGNADPTRADYGFGLGLAVRTTPGVVRLLGSVGDFSWPGASGTNWWADPQERLVVVFMAHSPGPARWHYRYLINTMVYEALEK